MILRLKGNKKENKRDRHYFMRSQVAPPPSIFRKLERIIFHKFYILEEKWLFYFNIFNLYYFYRRLNRIPITMMRGLTYYVWLKKREILTSLEKCTKELLLIYLLPR